MAKERVGLRYQCSHFVCRTFLWLCLPRPSRPLPRPQILLSTFWTSPALVPLWLLPVHLHPCLCKHASLSLSPSLFHFSCSVYHFLIHARPHLSLSLSLLYLHLRLSLSFVLFCYVWAHRLIYFLLFHPASIKYPLSFLYGSLCLIVSGLLYFPL